MYSDSHANVLVGSICLLISANSNAKDNSQLSLLALKKRNKKQFLVTNHFVATFNIQFVRNPIQDFMKTPAQTSDSKFQTVMQLYELR